MKNKTWGLVDSFFDKYDIVDHHIKSYNDFVENRIQKIIDITEPITIENEKGNYTLRTGKIKIEKPFTKEADGSKPRGNAAMGINGRRSDELEAAIFDYMNRYRISEQQFLDHIEHLTIYGEIKEA